LSYPANKQTNKRWS